MDGGPTIIGACHLASDLKKYCRRTHKKKEHWWFDA